MGSFMLSKLKYIFWGCLLGLFTISISFSQDWFKIDKPNILSNSGYSTYDQSISVKSDSQGNIYHTGYFEGVIVFGNDTLVSRGLRDLFVSKLDNQGNYVWAKSAGGNQSDYGKDLAINSIGEVFVTGYFFGKANFGDFSLTSSGNSDIFVAKLDSNGNWLWAKNANGGGFDRGNSIVTDTNRNAYVSGYYESTLTFGSTSLSSAGSKDIFVAKLDTNGNWAWAKSAGSTSSDESYNINIDKNNSNLVITGYFSSSATFGTTTLSSAGSRDPFVAKINVNGFWVWAKRTGSSNSDEVTASYIDNNNYIYVGGFYSKSFSIDTATLATPSDKDIWIAKMNTNGNWVWAKTLNGTKDDAIYSITGTNDNIFLSGSFDQNLSSGSNTINATSGRNAYYSKFDKNGNTFYLKSINGTPSVDAYCIAVNKDGYPFVVGTFFDKIIINSDTISSMGDSDIFVLQSDNDGNITKSIINYGLSGIVTLMASEVDKNKDVILSGSFYGEAIFGKDTLISNGRKDAFISKYSYIDGFLWSKNFGSKADDELRSVAIDSSNNYYFGGYFSDTISINNQNYFSKGFKDILIIKTNDNADISYIKTFGGSSDDDCNSMAVYQSSIAITGTYIDEINFGGSILYSDSYEDIFVLSITQSGNVSWSVKAGGQYFDIGMKIIAGNNNLYLAGSFEENATFGNIDLLSMGGDDMFVAKLNTLGNWIWAKSIGSGYYLETAKSLVYHNNNIYFAGNFQALMEVDGDFILNNGNNDIFVGKLTDTGNWVWKKSIGGPGSDVPYSFSFKDNKLFLTSSFSDIIYIENKTYSNEGNNSSLVLVLDINGNITDSFSENESYNSYPVNLLFLTNNNFILSGNFQSYISIGNKVQTEKWITNKNFYLALNGIEPISSRWEVISNTGKSSEIILPKSINPKIDNNPIAKGDAVGVFYIRNSNHYCAGYGIWNDEDLNLTVWGDNLSTLVKDGMSDNEKYLIKTWKDATGEEKIAKVKFSSGPSKFTNSAESIISHFPFYYDTLDISLTTGWNLISSNLLPYNLNLDTIFKNYTNDILIVKNSKGLSYIPSYNINNIGNWNVHQGYQVYSLQNRKIQILGEFVYPEDEKIIFSNGWSYLAYLRNSVMNIEDALESISTKGKLLLVKNSKGQAYIPSYNINAIGNMLPGQAYQVYFTAPDTLVYPANSFAKSISGNIFDYSPKFLQNLSINNLNNSTLLIEANKLFNDYELGVYNTNGVIIGSGRIIEGKSIITIYGNEEIAGFKNFISENEPIVIKVYDDNGEIFEQLSSPELINISNKNSINYKNNQIYKLALKDNFDLDLTISPNPAYDFININTNHLIKAIEYEIYDINNKLMSAGSANKINIETLSNGTYFLRIKIGSNIYVRKFIKMK